MLSTESGDRNHAIAWLAFSRGRVPSARRFTASGVFRFDDRPRSPCRSALSPRARKRSSSLRTQRTLSPNSVAACFCVMCRFLTSCRTLSRSRSFADIHSPSRDSAMTYKSGTFYCAQRGTSHVAATPDSPVLTSETVGSRLLERISGFPIRTLCSRITETLP
jgi:hypothetical protein